MKNLPLKRFKTDSKRSTFDKTTELIYEEFTAKMENKVLFLANISRAFIYFSAPKWGGKVRFWAKTALKHSSQKKTQVFFEIFDSDKNRLLKNPPQNFRNPKD